MGTIFKNHCIFWPSRKEHNELSLVEKNIFIYITSQKLEKFKAAFENTKALRKKGGQRKWQ